LAGKSDANRSLGRLDPRRGRTLREIGWGGLPEDRHQCRAFVNKRMKETSGCFKCQEVVEKLHNW
jgi:hypothetical protein